MSNLVQGHLALSVAHAIVNGQLSTPNDQKEVNLTQHDPGPQGAYADPEWGPNEPRSFHSIFLPEEHQCFDDPRDDFDTAEELDQLNQDTTKRDLMDEAERFDPPSEPEIPYEYRAESDEEALKEERLALINEAKHHSEVRRHPEDYRMRHNRDMHHGPYRSNAEKVDPVITTLTTAKLWGYYPSAEDAGECVHDYKRRTKKQGATKDTLVNFPCWKDVRYHQSFRHNNADLRSDKELWANYADISENTINYYGEDFSSEHHEDDDRDIMDRIYEDYEELERQDMIRDSYLPQYQELQEHEENLQWEAKYNQRGNSFDE